MNFQQIRAFHMVAQEGSLRRASEVLDLSQPTISQHLKGLEQRHGVRLFDKAGRGLVLTEAGTELFAVTKRLIETAGEVDDLLLRRHRSASGRLRVISDSPAIGVRIAAEVLKGNPDMDVTIRKGSVDTVIAALMDMQADVGIAVEPSIDPALLITPLHTEELQVCLRADSPLARISPFDLSAAHGQVLIKRERGSRTRALVERAMTADQVAPARSIEIEGGEIVREAVAHGLGIAFFAQSECPPDPRLVYLPVVTQRGQVGFVEHVIIRRDRRRVPEIAEFVRVAKAMRLQKAT